MRISDWSSDVCSSDLFGLSAQREFRRLADDVDEAGGRVAPEQRALGAAQHLHPLDLAQFVEAGPGAGAINAIDEHRDRAFQPRIVAYRADAADARRGVGLCPRGGERSEEHTSELPSIM